MRVFGLQALMRNESECKCEASAATLTDLDF
jgi:hypothetical protein